MAILLFSVSFSLIISAANKMVTRGFDRNKTLEIIGFVIFNPKKLNHSAKKIMAAIIMTLIKYFFMFLFINTIL